MPLIRSLALSSLLLASGATAQGEFTSADTLARPRVEVDYALHCQGCHLENGRGMTGKVPDLRGQLGRFMQVPGGRAYLVQVPGVATSRLDDAGTARLLNWLVARMGPQLSCVAPPFTAAEVRRLRTSWLRSARPVRERLVSSMDTAPVNANGSGSATCPG